MRREIPNRFSKVFKNSHNTIIYFYFFILLIYDIYILLQNLGLTNPTPLTEISSSRLVR
jgi:hypothetical protein